jgi:hypothetical protein
MNAREEYIAGLRELADLLEANPCLPAEAYPSGITVHVGPDLRVRADDDAAAVVDAAAAVLGVETRTTTGGHYEAVRQLPGGLSYRVLHIPAEVMADHEARNSYSRNIQTGGVDSESWTCAGCAGQMIGRRPADDRCHDCAPGGAR